MNPASMHLFVVASTIDRDLGGIARSVPALAGSIPPECPVTLLAPRAREDTLGTVTGLDQVRVLPCEGFRGVRMALREELANAAFGQPVLSHAGIWNSLNHYVAAMGRHRKIPVVVSIRSMLDPWALRHRKWKKRLAWWAYARRDLLRATAIHATAELEARHIRRALGPDSPPVFVVSNGIQLPEEKGSPDNPSPAGDPRTLLFLSRIHPKKGVLDLIRAFRELDPDGWELVIAGNDDGGHGEACRKLAEKTADGRRSRIRFAGPVKDDEKWRLYRQADLFVLPSYSENFGIVVGEALGMGVPVVTTTATPWAEYGRRESTQGGGSTEDLGLWITDPGQEPLVGKLAEVIRRVEHHQVEGVRRGAQWIRREFRWESVGRQYLDAVQRILISR